MNKSNITIDAKGRTIGRVATEVAMALRGKNKPTFERHIDPNVAVSIINASQIKIDPRKLVSKEYKRYSGYPGGLNMMSLEKTIAKKGFAEPLRLAVKGMLPSNKLRSKLLNNLTIHE
jgi:large subunit ribosomal protein L13